MKFIAILGCIILSTFCVKLLMDIEIFQSASDIKQTCYTSHFASILSKIWQDKISYCMRREGFLSSEVTLKNTR